MIHQCIDSAGLAYMAEMAQVTRPPLRGPAHVGKQCFELV